MPAPNMTISMAKAKDVSKELIAFVKSNGLSTSIAGKNFLQVEAWQFAGALIDTTPVVEYVKDLSTESEIKYEAKVNIIGSGGTIVSVGFAICSNRESTKKSFQEYAIASMAQTRAIGKAYRNKLAWIVKLAGYEPTPVDEIDKDVMEDQLSKAKKQVVAKMKENGYDDSSAMIDLIEKVTGKQTLDNVDDAFAVIAELDKDKS